MTSYAIEIADLRVCRGGRDVLHGLDFTVGRGSVTGLLGPSGGGKTTVMRAVVGVQAGVRGRVKVLGEPAGSPTLRARIGYVTQSPAVYADLTVRTNLDYSPPSSVPTADGCRPSCATSRCTTPRSRSARCPAVSAPASRWQPRCSA